MKKIILLCLAACLVIPSTLFSKKRTEIAGIKPYSLQSDLAALPLPSWEVCASVAFLTASGVLLAKAALYYQELTKWNADHPKVEETHTAMNQCALAALCTFSVGSVMMIRATSE